jgi:hypothetical protein
MTLLTSFPSNPVTNQIYLVQVSGAPTLQWYNGSSFFQL